MAGTAALMSATSTAAITPTAMTPSGIASPATNFAAGVLPFLYLASIFFFRGFSGVMLDIAQGGGAAKLRLSCFLGPIHNSFSLAFTCEFLAIYLRLPARN